MDLAVAGWLSRFGRTANNDETTFGPVLINTSDEDEARAVMDNDPAVKQGVMTGNPYGVLVSASIDARVE